MAFFGLPERDLLADSDLLEPDEDVAVYTWGEESYDGLGDALHEGGDDRNDETFGSSGPIGTYFLYGGPNLSVLTCFLSPTFLRQRFRLFESCPSGRRTASEAPTDTAATATTGIGSYPGGPSSEEVGRGQI
jgi:hypothetical protein